MLFLKMSLYVNSISMIQFPLYLNREPRSKSADGRNSITQRPLPDVPRRINNQVNPSSSYTKAQALHPAINRDRNYLLICTPYKCSLCATTKRRFRRSRLSATGHSRPCCGATIIATITGAIWCSRLHARPRCCLARDQILKQRRT